MDLRNAMKKTISGYRILFHKFGLIKTIKFMISWYYGQFQLRGKDLTKENTIITNDCLLHLIPNDKGISYELLKFKIHEPITTKILKNKLKEGMVCFDIGGNIGYYVTLENKLVGKNGKILVTEPSPTNRKYLEKNVLAQGTNNIEIFDFACGDFDGITKFSISKFSNYSQVFDEKKFSNADEVIHIPIRKLDTFLTEKNITKLDFIRMDIEGYELNVIEGAKECIKKFKPMIQIELHVRKLGIINVEKILRFFKNVGYDRTLFFNAYLDTPMVGSLNDVKIFSLTKLIKMLQDELMPRLVMVFLEYSLDNEENHEF